MAIRKQGKFRYADSQADIRDELIRYGKTVGYVPAHFRDVTCACSSKLFRLAIDDDAGAAVRICAGCDQEHPIGDSADYLDEAEPGECECPCGCGAFELTVGVALYPESDDVRWIYLGCRCPECGLTACYGDWKNEYTGYRELLDRA